MWDLADALLEDGLAENIMNKEGIEFPFLIYLIIPMDSLNLFIY